MRKVKDPAEFWRIVALEMVIDALEERGFNAADDSLETVFRRFEGGDAGYPHDPAAEAGAKLLNEFCKRVSRAGICSVVSGRPCTDKARAPLPCEYDEETERCDWCSKRAADEEDEDDEEESAGVPS